MKKRYSEEQIMGVEPEMIASAKFEMDRPYFEAVLREAIRNSGWLDRWKLPVSLLSVVLGVLVLTHNRTFAVLGGLLLAIGLFEFALFMKRRMFWVSDRMKSRGKAGAHCIELNFFEHGFTHSGPTSSGRVSWEGVHKVQETENALRFSIGDGLSIHVPKSSINPPEAVAAILRASKRGV